MSLGSETTIKEVRNEEEPKSQSLLPIIGHYHGLANEFEEYCRRKGYKTKRLDYSEAN
jgi:hypothetical protein